MTTGTLTNTVTASSPVRRPAADLAPDSRTLTGEHALLRRDVHRRAAPVLALVTARTWPGAELRTLTAFLRTSVLRQASDEEAYLFPNGASAPFAELTAEHVRLHTLTAQLDQADAKHCPLPKLRGLVEQLLTVLEHHLVDEQAVLAALPDTPTDVPSAADLVAGTQIWLAPNGQPVQIRLDPPSAQAVQLCIERLLRLRPGESAQICSSEDADLRRVRRWLHEFDSMRYELADLPADGARSILKVTRRNGA
ncbi:MAG: hemerythrin domain-containing protein [Jatrophihabitantaceae bacterium]